MHILEMILERSQLETYWLSALSHGEAATVKSRVNTYPGYLWKGYFFYKDQSNVIKAVPENSIRSKITIDK